MMDAGNFTEDEKVRASFFPHTNFRMLAHSPSVAISDTISQRFVLAEYIKASQVDTEQLVAFIKMHNLQADWFSMQLPGGELFTTNRSLSQNVAAPNLKSVRPKHAPMHARSIKHVRYRVGLSHVAQLEEAQIC